MKMAFKKIFRFSLVLLLSFFLLADPSTLMAEETPPLLGYGDTIPKLELDQPLLPEEIKYLHATDPKILSIKDSSTDLLIIEFTNKYCYHCIVQVPLFNELFAAIQTDPKLKAKVKMIGIGVGNNRIQVDSFRRENDIPFPIIPDPYFKVHDLVGQPNTPFTVLARNNKDKGEWIVASAHLGLIGDPDAFLDEMKAVLQYDISLLKPVKGKIPSLPKGAEAQTPIPDTEIISLIKNSPVAPGANLSRVEKILLPGNETVFMGTLDTGDGKKIFFSKMINQRSLCDFCYYNRFIFTFNEEGKVVNFIPIELGKYPNKPWDEEDVKKMKSRIIGTSILDNYDFNRNVDAVSTATATSLIIFVRLNDAKKTFQKLKDGGYLK
jgi:hypothetical protein